MNKKKIIKYVLLFIVFFVSLIFNLSLYRNDTFANMGFSYAISIGEIPYRDFNMVITPLSPFLYSLGFLLNKSLICFYVEQSLLLVLLFYLLEKMLGKKVYLFFTVLFFTWPISFATTIFPGYNFICFLLLMFLVWLEDNNKNDYLIGLVLGLLFCTKQTMGILCIPCVYYMFVDNKKLFKRILGFFIPVIILIIYLLITNSFMKFIDLCFLGLLNFGSSNKSIMVLCIIFLIIGVIYIMYNIWKDKKIISNYYFLLFLIVSLPIIDYYHVALFMLGPLFLLIKNINIKDEYYKVVFSIFIVIFVLNGVTVHLYLKHPVFADFNHFSLYVVNNKYKKNVNKLNKYLDVQDKEVILLLRGNENYMFKIMNDKKINYYDLPNRGNYGYDGEKAINKEINNKSNVLFVIDNSLCAEDDSLQQYICEFKESAIKNSTLVKTIGNYGVYYRE